MREYLARHSEREHRLWLAWLAWQWDRPDRHDHYLMLVALRVVQMAAKEPRRATLDQQRLRFGPAAAAAGPASREQATAWAKAKWGAALGITVPGSEG